MAVTVKKIVLWRGEIEHRSGALANALVPLAEVGADLQVVMAYGYASDKAAVELYPVSGRKVIAAAKAAGLKPSSIPALLVEGDNRRGLASAISQAIGDAGINIAFLVAQVTGRKYSATLGFETAADARKATILIRKAAAPKKR